jgi:chromate transporter
MKYLDIFWVFLKLGCTSFGGPIAHLMYFREAFVNKRAWLSEAEYVSLVALCQTLPGPASSQVGFSIGLIRGGLLGALLAFVAFTLPSVLLLIVFANYLYLFDAEIGQAVLQGLAILALAVVLHGVVGMGKNLCKETRFFTIATLTFVVLILAPSPLIQIFVIVFGAVTGYVLRTTSPDKVAQTETDSFLPQLNKKAHWTSRLAPIFAFLFLGLLLTLPLTWPFADDFYRSGALVFGGGHVVLPLLESAVVSGEQISQADFLAGYGATQAVPGPMFSFAAYLGFLMPGAEGGLSGAFIASLFIFLPGFLLVLAVLPYWQTMSQQAAQQASIAGASAAVVGVLAAALYDPIFVHAITQPVDLAIAAIAYAALSRWSAPVLVVVCFCIIAKVSWALFI